MHYKASTRSAISKLIKAKQSTKDMLCENKLTNLVFKTKKIMQNTICFLFLPSLFIIIIIIIIIIWKKDKQKRPGMKCMNVMQCKF